MIPLGTEGKLNLRKSFRRCSEQLLHVLCTIDVRHLSPRNSYKDAKTMKKQFAIY